MAKAGSEYGFFNDISLALNFLFRFILGVCACAYVLKFSFFVFVCEFYLIFLPSYFSFIDNIIEPNRKVILMFNFWYFFPFISHVHNAMWTLYKFVRFFFCLFVLLVVRHQHFRLLFSPLYCYAGCFNVRLFFFYAPLKWDILVSLEECHSAK